ncbi:trypsin-like peptidase domain-containing protein [Streptomyces sp. NPDC046977]|uniref:S1C family serine protease n=1 Tax=Streptomyces sp. NPDC046977 TaxID=3154703 RepID=UPI0033D5B320
MSTENEVGPVPATQPAQPPVDAEPAAPAAPPAPPQAAPAPPAAPAALAAPPAPAAAEAPDGPPADAAPAAAPEAKPVGAAPAEAAVPPAQTPAQPPAAQPAPAPHAAPHHAAPHHAAPHAPAPHHHAAPPHAVAHHAAPHAGPYAGHPAAPPAVPPTQPFGAPAGPGGPGGPVWGAPVPAAPEAPRKRGNGGLIAAVLVAALVAGGIGGGIGFWAADRNDSGSTTISVAGNPKDLSRAADSVAGIARQSLPSVVTIEASGSQESGTGTGFVYDKEGHILTNNHVVAPAADGGKLTATFSNGKKYDAEVVGRAQGYDVAVIKLTGVSPDQLTPLAVGDSEKVAVGDSTIAIGAPFGLSGTVTTGIVSALHRPIASSDGEGSNASYMSAIQTDASINPGNSGGPLLNSEGAVIGINSAIQSTGSNDGTSQAGSVGLGFAIPIDQARRVAEDLIKTGQPIYPVIGVSVDSSYNGEGAKIATGPSAVTAGGPAEKAGLRSGDVITKFDDTVVDSSPTLIGEIWQHQPGEKVDVTYTRDGRTRTATLTLGERKGDSSS